MRAPWLKLDSTPKVNPESCAMRKEPAGARVPIVEGPGNAAGDGEAGASVETWEVNAPAAMSGPPGRGGGRERDDTSAATTGEEKIQLLEDPVMSGMLRLERGGRNFWPAGRFRRRKAKGGVSKGGGKKGNEEEVWACLSRQEFVWGMEGHLLLCDIVSVCTTIWYSRKLPTYVLTCGVTCFGSVGGGLVIHGCRLVLPS